MSYKSVDYKAHETVFKQGEPGSYMCLIQNGEFEVVQELGGYEKQVAVLERGDFFGEMAILEDEPRTHSVRALSKAKLIKIERDDFPGLLVKKPDIATRMIRKLGNRLDPDISGSCREKGHGFGSVVVSCLLSTAWHPK